MKNWILNTDCKKINYLNRLVITPELFGDTTTNCIYNAVE